MKYIILLFQLALSKRTECEAEDENHIWWLEKCPGVGITGDNVIFATGCIQNYNYGLLMTHTSEIYSIAKISERKRLIATYRYIQVLYT